MRPSATTSIQQHALETDAGGDGAGALLTAPGPSAAQASATITVMPEPAMPDQDRSHLSLPAIMGITVALTGVAVVLGFLGWWLFARWTARKAEQEAKKRITVSPSSCDFTCWP